MLKLLVNEKKAGRQLPYNAGQKGQRSLTAQGLWEGEEDGINAE